MSIIYQCHVIYKWTNKINGKYYIGKHSTFNPWNDSYKGSGTTRWKNAKEKYGIENFTREILHIFNDEQEAYDKEHELVGLNEVKNPDCYNQKVGGKGARSGKEHHFYGKERTKEEKKKISKGCKGKKRTNEQRKKQSETLRGENSNVWGYKWTEEQKHKISGENHHMWGIKQPLHSKRMSEENNPNVKFTKEQAFQIKNDSRLYERGGISELAREWGQSRGAISHIKHGRTWSNVPKII